MLTRPASRVAAHTPEAYRFARPGETLRLTVQRCEVAESTGSPRYPSLSRSSLELSRIHQIHVEVQALQNFVQRNPVNSRGLHRDCRDSTFLHPTRNRIKITSERIEFLDIFTIRRRAGRHGHRVHTTRHINASGIQIDLFQSRRQTILASFRLSLVDRPVRRDMGTSFWRIDAGNGMAGETLPNGIAAVTASPMRMPQSP